LLLSLLPLQLLHGHGHANGQHSAPIICSAPPSNPPPSERPAGAAVVSGERVPVRCIARGPPKWGGSSERCGLAAWAWGWPVGGWGATQSSDLYIGRPRTNKGRERRARQTRLRLESELGVAGLGHFHLGWLPVGFIGPIFFPPHFSLCLAALSHTGRRTLPLLRWLEGRKTQGY
jgi:hypothetical protein